MKDSIYNDTPEDIIFQRAKDALRLWTEQKKFTACSSMDEVAEELGLEKTQLAFYFKKVIRKKFLTWRKELRIFEAQSLLLETDASASTVGALVGIPDKSVFARQFFEVTGMTPAEWRGVNGDWKMSSLP